MPFRSRSQQRFMFATNPTMAREFAEHTDFSKLPERVKKPKKGAKATKEARDLSTLELIPLVLKLASEGDQGPVNYAPAPMPNASCGACKHFAGGGCAKYEIAVDPSYTCDAFEPAVTSVTIDAPPPMDPVLTSGSTLDLAGAVPGTGTGIGGNSLKLGAELGKLAGLIAHVAGPSGSGKTTAMNTLAAAHPGLVTKDMDDFDNDAVAQLGWSGKPKREFTPQMETDLANTRQSLMDSWLAQQGDKPVVLGGHHWEGTHELKLPPTQKLLLNTSPLLSAIRAYRRSRYEPDRAHRRTLLELPSDWMEARRDRNRLLESGYSPVDPQKLDAAITPQLQGQEKAAMNDWYANGGADYYCPDCRHSFDNKSTCPKCSKDCSKHNKRAAAQPMNAPNPALPSVANALPSRQGNAAPPVQPLNPSSQAGQVSTQTAGPVQSPIRPEADQSLQQGYEQGLMARGNLPKSPGGVPQLRPKVAHVTEGQTMDAQSPLEALFGTPTTESTHAVKAAHHTARPGYTAAGEESRLSGAPSTPLTKLGERAAARMISAPGFSVAPTACGFLKRCGELGLSAGETVELVKVAAAVDFGIAREFAALAEYLTKEAGPLDAVARGVGRGAVNSADDVARGAAAGTASAAGATARSVASGVGSTGTRMVPKVAPPPAAAAVPKPAAPAAAPPVAPAAPKPVTPTPVAAPPKSPTPTQPTAPVTPKPAPQPTPPVTPPVTPPPLPTAATGAQAGTQAAAQAGTQAAAQASTGLATRIGNVGRAMEGVSPAAYAARQLSRLGNTRLGKPVQGLLDNAVGRGMNAVARNVVTKPLDYMFNLATGKGSMQNVLQGKFMGAGLKYGLPTAMLPMMGQAARGEKITEVPGMADTYAAPLQMPLAGARWINKQLPDAWQAKPGTTVGNFLNTDKDRFGDPLSAALGNAKDLASVGDTVAGSFTSPIRRQQALNTGDTLLSAPGMIARKMTDPAHGLSTDKQVKAIDEQLMGMAPDDPGRAALEARRKQVAVDPDYQRNLSQWQAMKDVTDRTLADPNADPKEVERAKMWQAGPAGQKPQDRYNPDPAAAGDTGAQLGAAAAGPSAEQQGLDNLEAGMQDAWLKSQDDELTPQARAKYQQQFEQMRQQHRQLAGQAGTTTQLKPMTPDEAKANDAAVQQANARLTELHAKAQSGQQLTPEEHAEFQQQQQALAQGAFRSAYSQVAQQTGMNPQQFQQGLAGNDPNNPVTQMGTQKAQQAMQQQNPDQPVDAGQAHGFWSGLEGWQKGMLLAGMGMGLFGLMAGFMGGEDGGMGKLAPLLGGLGMAMGGLGLARGKPSNLLDANYLRDLFSGTKPGDIPEMPTAASLGAGAGGGAPAVAPQPGGPVPPPATPPATPPAPGRPTTPGGPTAGPAQPAAPAGPVPQVRMPRGAGAVVPALSRDVQKPEVARALQPFMGPDGTLDTNRMLSATPQQLGPVWQNLSPEARTEVWNEANRTKDPQQRARAVATIKGLIANTK